jgi:hypothetical protein
MNGWADAVRQALDRPGFRSTGVAEGGEGGEGSFAWVLVDPERHPLVVWERAPRRIYARTARELDAAVFTNGPYVGRIGRAAVAARLSACVAAGAIAGASRSVVPLSCIAGQRNHATCRGRSAAGAALGALVGLGLGWRAALSGWQPCGLVRSEAAGIDDRRDWRGEGATHGWIGRSGENFESYAVGLGNPPEGLREAMGGLIPLIVDGEVLGADPADPNHHPDYARSRTKKQLVTWCLLPTPNAQGSGALLVVATRDRAASAELATHLIDLGVTGAVATDSSGCAMLGSGRRFVLGPPHLHRQTIQQYGLYCKGT